MSEDIRKMINKVKGLKEPLNEAWYHGTPESHKIEQAGGFTANMMSVDYITDLDKYREYQNNLRTTRESGNMEAYRKLLKMPETDFKDHFHYNKPLFLSDKYSVARTYTDPHRASDYQNSSEKVFEVEVSVSSIVKIVATGDRFRFINVDKVKRGFLNTGVPEEQIDLLIAQFNYLVSDKSGIKTDVIAAIGNFLGFDCIDVVGVLDSYSGGTTKSIVRMVLDPSKARIKK